MIVDWSERLAKLWRIKNRRAREIPFNHERESISQAANCPFARRRSCDGTFRPRCAPWSSLPRRGSFR